MQPEEESTVLEGWCLLFYREIIWLIPRGITELEIVNMKEITEHC